MKNKAVVFLAVLLLQAITVFAQNDFITLRENMQQTLDSIVAEGAAPGATLAVVLPDGRLISLAAGQEDPDLKKPMPVGGRMFTGSTGKTFVSAVALQLAAEGKFSLDDLLTRYFSKEKEAWFYSLPNAESLTVRSLMNHTSGLPRYIFQPAFLEEIKRNPMRRWTPQECLSVLSGMPPSRAVGKGWGYSDSNYILLGLLLEKVSGSAFYDLAQSRLIGPLELRNTYPSTQPELPGLIQGHIGDNNFFNLPAKTVAEGRYAMNPQFEWCGGGFVTNVEDMAHWLKWLHGGKVLPSEIYAELIEAVDFKTGEPAVEGYGLGTFVWQTDMGLFYGHAGIMPGYLTQVEYSADYDFSIALQFNSDQKSSRSNHAYVQDIARLILDFLEKTKLEDEQAIRQNFKQQADCWNRGSIDCYMNAYLPSDSIRTISRAGVTYGYENIRRNYFKYFPPDKMGKLHFSDMTLTRLSDQFYYVVGQFNLTYDDRPEPIRGWFSVIMQKVDGRWWMISDHSG